MLTEDFCDFETAKLLKEKNCPDFGYSCICDSEGNKAQTQSIIMKWLREVHRVCIVSMPVVTDDDGEAGCLWNHVISRKLEVLHNSECLYESSETACEAAIKYCLENLI